MSETKITLSSEEPTEEALNVLGASKSGICTAALDEGSLEKPEKKKTKRRQAKSSSKQSGSSKSSGGSSGGLIFGIGKGVGIGIGF